jgi:hypothetical protein
MIILMKSIDANKFSTLNFVSPVTHPDFAPEQPAFLKKVVAKADFALHGTRLDPKYLAGRLNSCPVSQSIEPG